MKFIRRLILLSLLLTAFIRPAQAGVFDTAGMLTPGHFSLGLEPALTFSPSSFMFNIHGGMGITHNIDMDLTLGVGDVTYFGAELEFRLIPDTRRSLGVAFLVGGHGTSHFGLDATLLVSNRFSTFSLYGALDSNCEFVNTHDDHDNTDHASMLVPVYIDLGVAIPISRMADMYLEGNIGITAPAASGLSGGVKFFF